eukprot:g14444.t1
MPCRFYAAVSARGAKGLAQQASRRLSLLARSGDAPAPAAARDGGLSRQPPATASSLSLAGATRAGLRTSGVAGTGQPQRFASPAGVTATIDYHRCPASGHPSSTTVALHPAGGRIGSGGLRRRGLATTPAPAATEDVLEDTEGGSDFGGSGLPAAAADNTRRGRKEHAGLAVTAEAVLGAEPAFAEAGGAGTSSGGGDRGGGAGGGGSHAATISDASGSGGGTSDFLADSNMELREHARRGEGDEAVALIARMREAGVTPTERSYTSAINACKNGAEAQWQQALALLREAATVGDGVTPNAYHYTAAIKTCGTAKRWDQVLSLKAEMDTLGITPGLAYYHWAIRSVVAPDHGVQSGAAQAGSPPAGWDAVRDLVAEMSREGVVPNQNSYFLVRQARSRIAPRTGDSGSVEGSGDGAVVDAELESAFGMLRGIDGAPEPRANPTISARNPERPAAKTEEDKSQTPVAVTNDASAAGQSEKAPDSPANASASSKEDDQPGTWTLERYNKKLREYARHGDGDKAAALISSMREAGVTPTARSYTSAINACRDGKESQWEQALALLREAATVGGGITPNSYQYTSAIKTCGTAKQWNQVLSLKAEMDSLGITPGLAYYHWAIRSVVAPDHRVQSGAAQAGSPPAGWDAVRDLVAEMSGKGVVPNLHSYALVRRARSRVAPRPGDGGSGESSGDGDVVDAELESAFGMLRGIDGAPEPRANPTISARNPERPVAKTEEDKSQTPVAVTNDASAAGQSEKAPDSPANASASSKEDDQPGTWTLERYNKKLREYARHGDGDKAAALISSMREAGVTPTARSYTSAINACKDGKESQWEQALALLRETATVGGGVAPNTFHYTAAIKACGNADQWEQIPPLVSEMESLGIRPHVNLYNWAIRMASGARTGPAMRAILTREGGWQQDSAAGTITTAASAIGGQSKSPSFGWEAATGLLRDMSAKGVAPSSITYTLVISACQKDREPEMALAVLREMQELAATATAASPIAEGLTEMGEDPAQTAANEDEDEYEAVIEEGAGPGGAGVDDSGGGRSGVTPNVYHFSSVMSAFVEEPGGWKRILALIKEMEAAGVAHNAFTYNSAIMACGKDGRWAEAVAVFRRMPKKGVVPDEVSFLAVIEACKQGGQWALAVALLREMTLPTVEAYTAALAACGNAGQWEVAVGLLREVTDGDVVAATSTVSGVDGVGADPGSAAAAAANGGAAADSHDEEGGDDGRRRKPEAMGAAVHEPVPLKPDSFLYNAAIEACAKAGQWEHALKLLEEISEIGLSPCVVSYNSAIAACAGADQWEKAVALLDEMRELGLAPVSSTFLPAIEACQRAGEGKLAYALTKQRDEAQRRMKSHPGFKAMKRGQRKKKRIDI